MCFSAQEALFLASEAAETSHLDDFLVAYPSLQPSDIAAVFCLQVRHRKTVAVMLDCEEHVAALDTLWHEVLHAGGDVAGPDKLRVCIDLDMSLRMLCGCMHVGAHRSPCHGLNEFVPLFHAIKASHHLELVGVMGYEAQVAGVMDCNPFLHVINVIVRGLKAVSCPDVRRKRWQVQHFLQQERHALDFFNGGGTGSMAFSCGDPALTEVTMGSGLLQSTIFDWFQAAMAKPAFCFALQCTRRPAADMVVAQSGGFIASGEVALDKTPQPFLPPGMQTFPHEGYGEVQTPLRLPAGCPPIKLGDALFFRPAKVLVEWMKHLAKRKEKKKLARIKQNKATRASKMQQLR